MPKLWEMITVKRKKGGKSRRSNALTKKIAEQVAKESMTEQQRQYLETPNVRPEDN